MAAMGPPGGGRNDITTRLTRHTNVLGVNEFDDNTMTRIFSTIMDAHFQRGFEPQFNRLGKVCWFLFSFLLILVWLTVLSILVFINFCYWRC